MKKIKKFLAVCLFIAMMVPFSVQAFATNKAEEGVLTVRGVGHGEFKIESTNLSRTVESCGTTICLMPVPNRTGMYEDESGTVYLKCTDTSLLQVDEVPIDVCSMDAVEQVIEGYGLSDVMADDLRRRCSTAEELSHVDSNRPYPQVVLYTARNPVSNTYSITPEEPRYYTYDGHKLKDDVLYTVYITPFKDYVFKGITTVDNLKNITDVSLYVTGAINKRLAKVSLVGSGVSLVYGLLQGWVNKFGESRLTAKDDDWSQFAIDYNSNTKYTSVENSQGNYPTCAKTGDVFVNSHGTNTYVNDCRTYAWYDVNQYAYTPNYPNPAPKAISAATGGIWIEEIEYQTEGGYVFCPNDV